ncbi:RCC1/BLIP-II [Ramaria rubella]|nr:RCC1/BLIP-II [Ramaria rubella]
MPLTTLRVFSAGSNAHGQLANGTLDDSHTFQPCAFAIDSSSSSHNLLDGRVVSIVCGANHTLLLRELDTSKQSYGPARQLWGCGDGRMGQLGPSQHPQNCSSSLFKRLDQSILDAAGVGKDIHIHAIAASWESTFIVLRQKDETFRHTKDKVIAMGNNDHGDLGVNLTPAQLKFSHEPRRVALEETLAQAGLAALSGFHVTHIAAGPHHVVATLQLFLLNGGEEEVVVGWGASRHGQLGVHPKPTRAHGKSTVTPYLSSPCLLHVAKSDSVNFPDSVVALALGSHHTVLLHRSGRVTAFGTNKKGQLAGLSEFISVNDVHCTWNGTYLTFNGATGNSPSNLEWQILATGSHDKGQLGHDSLSSSDIGAVEFSFISTTRQVITMACGSEHVLVLVKRTDIASGNEQALEEVWGWGWNEHGNLGVGTTVDIHVPRIIWPVARHVSARVVAVWAGCGTSWIVENPTT